MTSRKTHFCTWLAAAVVLHGVSHVAWAYKDGDVNIGVSASGKLMFEYDDDVIGLTPISGILFGWAGDEPGFFAIDRDEPDEDIFALAPGTIVGLEVLSLTPALKIWTVGFTRLIGAGDTWSIGPAPFDVHPIWHIDGLDPDFDRNVGLYVAHVRLVDLGGSGLAPSDGFDIRFAPIPEPASLALLAAGTMLLGRGRKRAATR